MSGRVLIAGVGNIFLGDDAFGVEAARLLARRAIPEGVEVIDFGIRGFDLAYALLEPWEAVILVDALPHGEAPGTLYVVEPDLHSIANQTGDMVVNAHGMDPVRVLGLAISMGEVSAHVYVVGCEPADFGDELEGRMGLSTIVESSLGEAVRMVEELVASILVAKTVCIT